MSETSEASAPQSISRWVGIVGLFIAPTTVITALCFYFGYVFTRTYFAYFGVDTDAIGFTTADYVLKSVSVLYAPIIVLLLAWVALLWAGAYIRRLTKDGRRTRLIHRAAWIVVIVGALSTATGLVGVARPRLVPDRIGALTPVTLGLGTILVIIGVWMLATSGTASALSPSPAAQRASLVAAVAVIVLALFWVTNIYATAYGQNQAEIRAGKLWPQETTVVLDTSKRLGVPPNLIVESPLPSGDQEDNKGNGFRYECFRELAVRGDRWVLVPARWTPQNGYAIIVTTDPGNRISTTRFEGIADTEAAIWAGDWQCPEVAPPDRLATTRK